MLRIKGTINFWKAAVEKFQTGYFSIFSGSSSGTTYNTQRNEYFKSIFKSIPDLFILKRFIYFYLFIFKNY